MSKALFRIASDGRIEIVECPDSIRECSYMKRRGANPIMVAYLLYIGKAEVKDCNGNPMDLEDLVKMFGGKSMWIVFSTYLDLRRRGKVPDLGAEPRELMLEKDRMCIYVYEENAKVKPIELAALVERGLRRDCRVVIAIVDMYGDVTYYEVTKMTFPRIERR